MNLADAIRQVHVLPDAPVVTAQEIAATVERDTSTSPALNVSPQATNVPFPMSSEDVTPVAVNGNAIRLELFLNAEQMNSMLRAIMSGHHSVMTPSEAARYLRIPVTQLEKMAEESAVPALKIEGRWRYPKAALDEWLTLRSFRANEGAEEAA